MFRAFAIMFGIYFIMIGVMSSQKRKPHWGASILVGFLLVALGFDPTLVWLLVQILLRFLLGYQ